MDDKDKSAIEKVVDQINDAVERITTVAPDALQKAMEPDPVKPNEQAVASTTKPEDGTLTGPVTPPVAVVSPGGASFRLQDGQATNDLPVVFISEPKYAVRYQPTMI